MTLVNRSLKKVFNDLAFITCSVILVFCSCSKTDHDDENPIPPLPTQKITGTITLPSGSPHNPNALNVISTTEEVAVSNNKYNTDSIQAYSTQFVVNSSNAIVMMKYNYPGQKNYDISPQSTALAIIMNSPSIVALDNSSKLKMINDLASNPDFITFTSEVEKAIKSGNSYLIDNNSSFMQATANVFAAASKMKKIDDSQDQIKSQSSGSVSNTRITTVFDEPIKFDRSGKSLSFTNLVANPFVIAVYKDNGQTELDQFVLDGAQVFPKNIKELFEGVFGNGYGSVPNVVSNMTSGDGNYQFKIRSGKPGTDKISPYQKALKKNLEKLIIDIAIAYLKIPINSECITAIRKHATSYVETVAGLPTNSNSLSTLGSVMHDLSIAFFKSTNDLFKCANVNNQGSMSKFVNLIGTVVKFVDKTSEIGATMNVSAQLISLYKAKAVIDTCFTVTGSSVTTCQNLGSVKIGTQVWTNKNLDVTTYRNGDPIPQVTDPAQWEKLTTGAWCYYDNDPANGAIYGKLYNWYAVNDPRGLAPQGWHIPTHAEWRTLIMYVGGDDVAGGRLKATHTWRYPNIGATNSFGFTALPGGQRRKTFSGTSAVFGNMGNMAYFWSSTKTNSNSEARCLLLWNDERVIAGGDHLLWHGLSVRAVKD